MANGQTATTPITSLNVYDSILQQQQQEAVVMLASAYQYWNNATLAMANVNYALNLSVANLAALHDNVSAAEIWQIYNPAECVVDIAADYIANATLAQVFICCHLKKIRYPALLGLMSKCFMVMQGLPGLDDDGNNMAASLQGLQTMQFLELAGFDVGACLDDASIFRPQQAIVARAIPMLDIMGFLLQTYESIAYDAASLAGCLNATSGCSYTGPLSYANQTQTNSGYWQYDPAYLAQCGNSVLGAFYSAQRAPACGVFVNI